jgi:CheY-like chemotaxis protein
MLAVRLPLLTDDIMNTQASHPRCHWCAKPFDLQNPIWCGCDGISRTLVCPSCLQCFCTAPLPYKRRFWTAAPRHVREHVGRFRSAPLKAERSADPRLILVVDDDELNRSLVASVLESWGCRVMTAADGQEGLLLFLRHQADIVITDALMPKMDGREMALRIKNSEQGANTKVILMTSLYTKFQHRAEAFKSFRVDDFLLKPLKFPELAAAMQRAMPMTEVA